MIISVCIEYEDLKGVATINIHGVSTIHCILTTCQQSWDLQRNNTIYSLLLKGCRPLPPTPGVRRPTCERQ